MVSRRAVIGLGVAAGAMMVGGAVTAAAYSSALNRAREKTSPSLSSTIDTRFGTLEYAERGDGLPLLMSHGTGGGFDQGLLFAGPLLTKGYRIISPSRFGYLRSSFPSDPSSANQADAFVQLLDHLAIEKVAIAGGSAGALSAIEFAIRHPDRCSMLLPIVPAAYAPGRDAVSADNPPAGLDLAMTLLRSDFLFWSALTLLPDAMTGTLLATNPALLKTVDATEQARAREILWAILPVSARADGLLNDARLAGHPAPQALEKVSAPTFVFSVEDDRFGTAKAARHIAANVAGARLTIYPTGGHIWLGHNTEMFNQIDELVRKTALT